MTDDARLTDRLRVVALDAGDYGEREAKQTRIATANLREALEVIEDLGWSTVDVSTIESLDEDVDNPALALQPPAPSYTHDEAEQAAIMVASMNGGDE